MTPVWITLSDLGIFASNHNFTESPLTLQYSGSKSAVIDLVDGALPTGLQAVYYPNNVRLIGTAALVSGNTTYAFTFKITEPTGETVQRQFYVQLLENPVPIWLTQSNLPTRNETYSYTLNPLVLEFTADPSASVTLLNGNLPSGLTWDMIVVTNNIGNIVIKGETTGISALTDFQWTFRITNPNGTIADRTFYLQVIPLVDLPDWSSQSAFLGYATSNTIATFRVYAKSKNQLPLSYSLVGTVPTGMTINRVNGLITWNAPQTYSNQNYAITVRAQTTVAYSDVMVSITLLYSPQPPVWATPSTLESIPQGSFLQKPLVAYEALGMPITYTVPYALTDFPFQLDPQGLLFGEAPTVSKDTSYTIYVLATSTNGSTLREFNFKVTKVNQAGVLSWDNDQLDVELLDGQLVVLDVGATSTRKPTVLHGMIGGQLPPGLILDKIQGRLVGFLDYHAVTKDYWIELIATDDIDTITKKIHIKVVSQYGYQFASLSIPLTGDIKQQWITTVQYCVTAPNSIPNVQVVGNTLYYPSLNLVKGLDFCIKNPDEIISAIVNKAAFESELNNTSPLLELQLAVGKNNTAIVDSSNTTLLYREIIDPQEGTAYNALTQSDNPNSIIPASIYNIREAFIRECGLANSGTGKGAGALATVNLEDGSVTRVSVVNPGSGYTSHPSIVIQGEGTGAKCRAIMKIVGVEVIDPGTNWEVGEYIVLGLGNFTTAATLVVTQVGTNGALEELYIVNGGAYLELPIGKLWIKNAAGVICGIDPDLGVGKIELISGGVGYNQNTTYVSFGGTEILEPWQKTYTPYIPIALITPAYSNTIVNNSNLSVTKLLDGARWQVGDFIWSVEGIYWEGTSSFDDDCTTFDGKSTCFEETLEPSETTFDTTYNTYDLYKTYFDVNDRISRDSHANWGQTVFDEYTTAFEFYATIFDAIEPPKESRTTIKRLVSLQEKQWSGNNTTDWSIS